MNFIELAKEYTPLLNALLVFLVLIKLLADSRRHRLEQEKLARELTELRQRETEAAARLLNLAAEDVKRLVLDPLLDAMHKRDQEMQNAHRRLIEAYHQSATTIHEQTRQRDKELQETQRLVVEAFYHAAESIRQNTERAALGSKLASLVQENTQTLLALREQLGPPAQKSDTRPSVPS